MAEKNNQNTQQELSEILQIRRDKLKALQDEGRNPFDITKFDVSHHAQEVKDNFDALVMHSNKPVLLDFWATWCGPCRMVAPIVAEIAQEREDVLVGKVNVDEELELAMQFGITSIPTLVLLQNGQVMDKLIGYRPKAEIERLLDV